MKNLKNKIKQWTRKGMNGDTDHGSLRYFIVRTFSSFVARVMANKLEDWL